MKWWTRRPKRWEVCVDQAMLGEGDEIVWPSLLHFCVVAPNKTEAERVSASILRGHCQGSGKRVVYTLFVREITRSPSP